MIFVFISAQFYSRGHTQTTLTKFLTPPPPCSVDKSSRRLCCKIDSHKLSKLIHKQQTQKIHNEILTDIFLIVNNSLSFFIRFFIDQTICYERLYVTFMKIRLSLIRLHMLRVWSYVTVIWFFYDIYFHLVGLLRIWSMLRKSDLKYPELFTKYGFLKIQWASHHMNLIFRYLQTKNNFNVINRDYNFFSKSTF